MKRTFLNIAFTVFALSAFAQAQDSTQRGANGIQFSPLKTNDQVLPRWAVDLTYRYGTLSQKIEMFDYSKSYMNSLNQDISDTKFSNGGSHSVNLQLGYFFGKKRIFGIGTGVSLFLQRGMLSIDKFTTQYQSTDANGETFRQVLTAHTNGGSAIREQVNMTNVTVPLMLKFKHQFKGDSKFGLTLDAGGFLGVSSSTNTKTANASFDYEAIYKYDAGGNATYDSDPNINANSEKVTRQFWTDHQTTDVSPQAYFERKRNEGMNVALDTLIANGNTHTQTKYNKLSYGFLVQPAITYYLNYNVTFVLGGYYMYQVFQNNDAPYVLTDKVGQYNAITNGIRKNTATSLGLNVGFRFFFGEKRDIDGDHIPDKDDLCPLKKGDSLFHGCPDYDKDGIPDDDDKCPYVAGVESANGCPDADGDGIPDDQDDCPNQAGRPSPYPELKVNGCPPEHLLRALAEKQNVVVTSKTEVKQEENLITKNFDVLKTDVILFDLDKAEISPSSHEVLDQAVAILSKNSELLIFVSGYTDASGSYEKNMKLSFDRATAVSNYLQSMGVSKDRIIISGYGKDNPFASNDTPENRALNRRTVMRLLLPLPQKK